VIADVAFGPFAQLSDRFVNQGDAGALGHRIARAKDPCRPRITAQLWLPVRGEVSAEGGGFHGGGQVRAGGDVEFGEPGEEERAEGARKALLLAEIDQRKPPAGVEQARAMVKQSG